MSTHTSVPSPAAHGGADQTTMFQLVPQTAPLAPHELESGQSALEIVIMWGDTSVLHVAHLSPPRSFYLGELAADGGQPDFVIGAQSLGCECLPIVLESAGEVSLVIPAGAGGDIEREGSLVRFDELAEQGLLRPADASPGALAYPISLGARARVQRGSLTFLVNWVEAAERVGIGGAPQLALSESRWTLASTALHGFLLACFYFLPPATSAYSMDMLNPDGRWTKFATDAKSIEVPLNDPDLGDPGEGGGATAKGDEGATGEPDKPKQPAKRKVAAPAATAQAAPDRLGAASAGIIALLRRDLARPSDTRFARESANGYDAESALTALLGAAEASNGFYGAGIRGTGRGGGGNAEGAVGVGPLGTRGKGTGVGGEGYGDTGPGLGMGQRTARVPRIRHTAADVMGSLSKETIRRIVGRHEAEVRFCYQQQLVAHPDLQGRVAIKFIISPTGEVKMAQVASSDLGNAQVGQCIASAVQRWSFPSPEGGGLVVVTYPFMLSQTGT